MKRVPIMMNSINVKWAFIENRSSSPFPEILYGAAVADMVVSQIYREAERERGGGMKRKYFSQEVFLGKGTFVDA